MNLTPLDWTIVALLFTAFFGTAIWSKRLTRSVSDFLAANRCAGRYLLTLADGAAAFGVVTLVANFEKFYAAGFGAFWWGMILAPLASIAALSGWVAYRYRETRSLTMGEMFERRYNRKFRIYAGILCFVSGLLNYGIFPMVTANLLQNLFGFPDAVAIAGLELPSRALIMLTLLTIAAIFTLAGGLITVMVTDFIQSQILFISLIAITLVCAFRLDWDTVSAGLLTASPGRSMINPFDQKLIDSFNLFFFCVFAFKIFYNYLGWQSGQGYFAAAKTPHEFRMSRILGEWRNGALYLVALVVPIAVYVFLKHPDFTQETQGVVAELSAMPDPQTAKQLTVPLVLTWLLPSGVLGLFAAALIFSAIATDDTQLHSWGSIFIQDVLLPIRGKPFTPKNHLRALRWAVIGVAAFAFTWSMFFPLRDYVLMYMLATGTIYLGGSGAVIIGGLYWRRATTAGAFAAMSTGALIGITAVLAQGFWPQMTVFHSWLPVFPLSGVQIALTSYLSSITVFICVSLLTTREPFNLEKLLHRGAHAIPEDATETHALPEAPIPLARPARFTRLYERLGITPEFTVGDKTTYLMLVGWTTFWLLAFVIGTTVALTLGVSEKAWLNWWRFVVVLSLSVGLITVVWFIIGGVSDFRDLTRRLTSVKKRPTDDGWVP